MKIDTAGETLPPASNPTPSMLAQGGADPTGATRAADDTVPGSFHARMIRGLARGATVGRYLVLEEIGRGGMGVVYAAYDPDLDRRIAIKVLRGRSDEGSAGSARLLREAQALAKLAHPNVIAVFDVGTVPTAAPAAGSPPSQNPGRTADALPDEIFVAMELVPGGTLREAVEKKAWREIVAAYVAAGRGLAAAHAAGLVHRDFKPENVLVGADGRPRVTDFGLVRATAGGATDPDPGRGRRPSTPSPLDSDLTAAGTVMGTPSYMAPEQMVGQPTSAATDQYSFGVALWEALFGAKPYPGTDVSEMHAAVREGKRAAYERGDVPVRVVRALDRALAAEADARWPAMDALLAELEAASRQRAPRWIAGSIVGAGLVALAVVGLAARGKSSDECARAGDPAADVWSRGPVEAAFRAAAPAYGAEAVTAVETRIGSWRDEWQRRARGACTATRVQRTQSDEVLDLRMSCMNRELASVRALVGGLAHADTKTVERVSDVLAAMPDLADCDDIQVLRGRQSRPSEREKRIVIETLERELGELHGRRVTTFAEDARKALAAELDGLVTRAEAAGYAPVVAEARWIRGELALDRQAGPEARADLLAAAAAAIRGGDPGILADAYLGLAEVATDYVVDLPAARAWLELADAVVDGLREPGHRAVQLAAKRATLAREDGDYKAARAALDEGLALPDLSFEAKLWFGIERALVDTETGEYDAAERGLDEMLAMATAQLGANHPRSATVIYDRGNVAFYRGQYARAAELHGKALALREAAYGKDSPELIDPLDALGVDENLQGHLDVALGHLERALAIARARYGREHTRVAFILSDLAGVHNRAKEHDKELEVNREVLAIRMKVLGPDHMDTAMTMVNVGIAAKNLGRARKDRALVAEAIANEEKARGVFVAKLGEDHFNVGAVDANLGEAYRAAGRIDDAIAAYARAEATFAKAVGADHPAIADPLTGHGLALVERGRAADAIALLERAVKLRSAPDVDAGDLADSNFALAKALRATGKDPARAADLARAARDVWKTRGAPLAARVTEATTFLGE